ncbi:hypothetical protein LCGC14_1737290, partial [marine sediment metagenome]
MWNKTIILILVMVLLVLTLVSAEEVSDVAWWESNNITGSNTMSVGNSGDSLASQSFQMENSHNVNIVSIYAVTQDANCDIAVTIETDNAGFPSDTLLNPVLTGIRTLASWQS